MSMWPQAALTLGGGILPNLVVIDQQGVREVSEGHLEEVVRSSLGEGQ